MIAWKLSEILRHAQGQLVGADREFTSVSTDTRTIKRARCSSRSPGRSFDGHDFVATAAQNGAAAALVSRPLPVDRAASGRRRSVGGAVGRSRASGAGSSSIPVVGVTGSNGKTTTKELIGSILSQLGPTLVTRGNLNNHIGVPLTLLELTEAASLRRHRDGCESSR